MNKPDSAARRVAIIGAGPAGLMAAETVTARGDVQVDVYDAMPSAGRKFLLAGKGGLNITHSEPLPAFLGRYGAQGPQVAQWLDALSPTDLREWVHGLGVDTFVGSSGRVFPAEMKAAPLLRAWMHRLREAGVRFHQRHRWLGFAGDLRAAVAARRPPALRMLGPAGEIQIEADAVILALGGASWARLGSDGAWVPLLEAAGVALNPLVPANCGFDVNSRDPKAGPVGWSPWFAEHCAGTPLKAARLRCVAADGSVFERRGELMLTATGVEGSLIYAASRLLRDTLLATGRAQFTLDLLPDRSAEWIAAELAHPRGRRSFTTHLKTRLNLPNAAIALLRECLPGPAPEQPALLAAALKALPVELVATRPIDEAISTAGGVRLDALTDRLELKALPGVFCAGEMLDWEAPTGGYLLNAVMASGRVAGRGAVAGIGASSDSNI
ncbi:TIGR03862 family flavoprotein [Piscinibacterium candidicorallinum]|uniref:TIGR03862 family flavoprotein n=1 Tax=Piscinibacterium candidicorallinum TaxID=1793872 RepID=A0ABV7H571_9BURK